MNFHVSVESYKRFENVTVVIAACTHAIEKWCRAAMAHAVMRSNNFGRLIPMIVGITAEVKVENVPIAVPMGIVAVQGN